VTKAAITLHLNANQHWVDPLVPEAFRVSLFPFWGSNMYAKCRHYNSLIYGSGRAIRARCVETVDVGFDS
jgi:hypothetical protein